LKCRNICLGNFEAAITHPLAERTRDNIRRRAAEHALGFVTDCQDSVGSACTATTDGSRRRSPGLLRKQVFARPKIDADVAGYEPKSPLNMNYLLAALPVRGNAFTV